MRKEYVTDAIIIAIIPQVTVNSKRGFVFVVEYNSAISDQISFMILSDLSLEIVYSSHEIVDVRSSAVWMTKKLIDFNGNFFSFIFK